MSILKSLINLFHHDEFYIPMHEDPFLKRGLQNRLYITPKTRLGSLPTVKRELKKSRQDLDPDQE